MLKKFFRVDNIADSCFFCYSLNFIRRLADEVGNIEAENDTDRNIIRNNIFESQ